MSITLKGITKRFPPEGRLENGHLAVDDVSFTVPKGQLVALLGPSGSGKSTILRIIAGLEIPDKGQVELEGRPITGSPVHSRGIGFVFQHYALFKHATVKKNIAFGLSVRKWPGKAIRSRVDELLELVQLKGYENRYPSQLSGGQRQRVALARALAPRPQVLLLDEPFGALDAKVRRNLANQLRALHDEVRTTTVFVTHDQEEAIEIADKIVVLNRGRVEQIGHAEEIYDHPLTKFVASFIGNVNVIEGMAVGGILRIGSRQVPIPQIKTLPGAKEVILLVRPEDISLCIEPKNGDLEGSIREIRYRGDRFEQELDVAGMVIRRLEEKARCRGCSFRPGQRVGVRFNHYQVFDADQDHAVLRSQLQSLGYIE